MARQYQISLPAYISGIQASLFRELLHKQKKWFAISEGLRNKLEEASFWTGIDIHKNELDSLDDHTWNKVKRIFYG